MKIVVDKLPATPRDCLFSEEIANHRGVYGCKLTPYIEKINSKPKCLCKSVNKCNNLIVLGDVKIKGDIL